MENFRDMKKIISKRIKEERKTIGLNQSQLADKLGKSTANISGYETGDRLPPIEVLHQLADIFDCSADYLLGRSPHRDYSIEKMNIDGKDYYVGIKKEAMNKLTSEQKLELAKELINDTVK